jgi:NAD(P)-dependent dehydrogenase (short-subunit alcohol dehydrogenase family)
VTGTVVDVRNADEVNAWIGGIAKTHGEIHGGANVAGIGGGWKPTTIANIVRPFSMD